MRPMAIIGVLLIVLGILAFGYQGVVWVTGTENVAHIGPVDIWRTKEFPIPLAPILAAAGVGIGLLLLMAGSRRTID